MPRTRDARPTRTFFFSETLSWFSQTFQLPFNLAPDI